METLFYILLIALGIAAYTYYKAQFFMGTTAYQLKMYYSKAKDNDERRKLSYIIISRYLSCDLTQVKSKYFELIKSNPSNNMVNSNALYHLSGIEEEKFGIQRELTPSGIMNSWLNEYYVKEMKDLGSLFPYNNH